MHSLSTARSSMNKLSSDRILAYRRNFYRHISLLLDVYDSGATVEDAAKRIFEHDEATRLSECLADLLMMLNPCEEDYLSFMPVIQDAWNYFPHRSLGWREMAPRQRTRNGQPRYAGS